jgi:hypothetical protein
MSKRVFQCQKGFNIQFAHYRFSSSMQHNAFFKQQKTTTFPKYYHGMCLPSATVTTPQLSSFFFLTFPFLIFFLLTAPFTNGPVFGSSAIRRPLLLLLLLLLLPSAAFTPLLLLRRGGEVLLPLRLPLPPPQPPESPLLLLLLLLLLLPLLLLLLLSELPPLVASKSLISSLYSSM